MNPELINLIEKFIKDYNTIVDPKKKLQFIKKNSNGNIIYEPCNEDGINLKEIAEEKTRSSRIIKEYQKKLKL